MFWFSWFLWFLIYNLPLPHAQCRDRGKLVPLVTLVL